MKSSDNKKTIKLIAAYIAICMLFSSCSGNFDTEQSKDTTAPLSENTAAIPSTEPLVTEPSQIDPPKIEEYEYELVFSEEFEGDSLDTSKWKYRTDKKSGGENRKENVFLKDGKLYIKFDKDHGVYTGGGIISKELFGYGYYETKCRLFCEGGGLHSAFWLMSGSGNGEDLPKNNLVFEIDGFEFDSDKPDIIQFNLNYKIGKTYGLIEEKKIESLSGREVICGFEWLPDRVNWYLDGELMHTVNSGEEPLFYAQQAVWLTALANTAMSGEVNEALLPAYTYFEYFRYYAKPLKDINLIGSGEFEYNSNVAFSSETDKNYPISFCESGDIDASKIEVRSDAYGGNCMLVHKKDSSFSSSTYQRLFNIPNGTYTASCYVKGTDSSIFTLSVGDKAIKHVPTDKWTRVEISGISVDDNSAVVSLTTDGRGEVLIDDLSFASENGCVTPKALYYPNYIREDVLIGEIYLNTRSMGFSASEGWKKSSVVGAEFASMYKLSATGSDYAEWEKEVGADGEYSLSVYNIISSGKIPKQRLSVYSGAITLCTYDIGSVAGWETIGNVTLKAGDRIVIRIENGKGNSTMRADSVRLLPASSVSYSDCIVFSRSMPAVYAFGLRNEVNDIPMPLIENGAIYLSKEVIEKALSKSFTDSIDKNGGSYISDAQLALCGYKVYVTEKTVVVCPSSFEGIPDAFSASSELFIE